MDVRQKRLKKLELLGSLGAGILGAGIASLSARSLASTVRPAHPDGWHLVAWLGDVGEKSFGAASEHRRASLGDCR